MFIMNNKETAFIACLCAMHTNMIFHSTSFHAIYDQKICNNLDFICGLQKQKYTILSDVMSNNENL